MEPQTSEERNESEQPETTTVALKDLPNEALQAGIDANLAAMVNDFVSRLKMLESMIGRKVDIRSNAKIYDGRKLHIRIR